MKVTKIENLKTAEEIDKFFKRIARQTGKEWKRSLGAKFKAKNVKFKFEKNGARVGYFVTCTIPVKNVLGFRTSDFWALNWIFDHHLSKATREIELFKLFGFDYLTSLRKEDFTSKGIHKEIVWWYGDLEK